MPSSAPLTPCSVLSTPNEWMTSFDLVDSQRDRSTAFRPDALVPIGIPNPCNTCYIATALRTLFMLMPLREALLNDIAPPEGVFDSLPGESQQGLFSFWTELSSSLHQLKYSGDPLMLRPLVDAMPNYPPIFSSMGTTDMARVQGDASDLFLCFFNFAQKRVTSTFDDMFDGKLLNLKVSSSNRSISERHELPVADPYMNLHLSEGGLCETLEDCLEQRVFATTILEMFKFSIDGKDTIVGDGVTEMSTMFRILPKVLLIFTGRLSLNYDTLRMAKNLSPMKFGEGLDMKQFVVEGSDLAETRYSLLAVHFHCGHSADSGHYVLRARDLEGNWFYFSDSMVKRLVSFDAGIDDESEHETLLVYARNDVLGEIIPESLLPQKIAIV